MLHLISALGAAALLPVMASENPLDFNNAIGLTVEAEDSENCEGSNPDPQRLLQHASVSGGGSCPVKLAITVTGIVEGQDAGYDFIYVNDVLFFSSDDNDTECAMITKTVTKEVTVKRDEGITISYDTVDGNFHSGAYATITHIEVIEEACSSGCEAGGASMENGSVHVSMNLGRAVYGKSVGALRIVESVPSAVLGTPASLRYSSAWEGVQVIRDTHNSVRQVKAPQCLADVVTETPAKFHVDFYDPSNIGTFSGGLYDQSNKVSYVTWIYENLDTVNHGHLQITQVRGATSVLNEFIWDATAQGWELLQGNGQRKEK